MEGIRGVPPGRGSAYCGFPAERNHGLPVGTIGQSEAMRAITYAGGTVITSDDVAATLVELSAALARRGQAEAVRIPIVLPGRGTQAWAELVVGVGNDVLSVPCEWEGREPDFDGSFGELLAHLERVRPRGAAEVVPTDEDDLSDRYFDLDVDFGRSSGG